jgi:hypothetical protein
MALSLSGRQIFCRVAVAADVARLVGRVRGFFRSAVVATLYPVGQDMRRRGKVDANHAVIVATLKLQGWRVLDCSSLGHGAPDLIAFHPGRDCYRLVEIKDGAKKKLTADQERFIQDGWRVAVVRSVDDALNL